MNSARRVPGLHDTFPHPSTPHGWRDLDHVIRWNALVGRMSRDERQPLGVLITAVQDTADELNRWRDLALELHPHFPGSLSVPTRADGDLHVVADPWEFRDHLVDTAVGRRVGSVAVRRTIDAVQGACGVAGMDPDAVIALLEGPLLIRRWWRVLLLAPTAVDVRTWNYVGWPDDDALDLLLEFRLAGLAVPSTTT